MIPLVDTHCHLLTALDDGPRSEEESVEMCRLAWEEGTRVVAATGHINEERPEITPDRIRAATARLAQRLKQIGMPLTLYPCSEVRIRPELERLWLRGELLGMAGMQAYLLVELPEGLFFDLSLLVGRFAELGVHVILAHPERHAELVHDPGRIERLVRLGCLIQVSSDSITEPLKRDDEQILRRWVREGLVHLVCSDGHSPRRRPPRLAEAHRRISSWAGAHTADRLCSINGLIVLEGLPLKVAKPKPPRKRWFSRL